MKGITDKKKAELKREVHEAWTAYLLLRGSDQNKYGSLMKNLSQQFSLGNDQYPKTLVAVINLLSNHKIN